MLNAIRGATVITLFTLNLFLWGTPLLIIGIFKLLMPTRPLRTSVVRILVWIAERWSYCNRFITRVFLPTRWTIEGDLPDDREGHYLILCNHQSWVDIIALFDLFTGRLPFIRFFLKRELIWVPIVGAACQAMEFPFMKRYSPEYLAHHPEKRGEDLRTTYRACRRYRWMPVAVASFLEGTRFSEEKRRDEESPYRHLLRPKTGGISYVLATLGDLLDGAYDVTLAYPGVEINLWNWVCGRVPRIAAHVRRIEIPPEFISNAITEPGPERDRFKAWLHELWAEKDGWLETTTGS